MGHGLNKDVILVVCLCLILTLALTHVLVSLTAISLFSSYIPQTAGVSIL